MTAVIFDPRLARKVIEGRLNDMVFLFSAATAKVSLSKAPEPQLSMCVDGKQGAAERELKLCEASLDKSK